MPSLVMTTLTIAGSFPSLRMIINAPKIIMIANKKFAVQKEEINNKTLIEQAAIYQFFVFGYFAVTLYSNTTCHNTCYFQ